MITILHHLKKLIVFSLFFTITTTLLAQTATPPSSGDGSEGNPYEIATLNNLYWLTQNSTEWDKHYIQTANIDATETAGWDSGAGFTPIGNSTTLFTGSYNGKGFTINKLFINRPTEDNIGLFGETSNYNLVKIDSLSLINVNITGRQIIGALVGMAPICDITNCYSTGTISSPQGTSKTAYAGGLVGFTGSSTDLYLCYSDVTISTDGQIVGGLVGISFGRLKNCYSSGIVSGWRYIGGLAGKVSGGLIENCYSSTDVNMPVPTNNGGGLIAERSNTTVNSSFWDIEVSGFTTSAGGVGLSTAQMKSPDKYLVAGWDFMDETINGSNNYWGHNIAQNNGYPFLAYQDFSNIAPSDCYPMSQVSNIAFSNVQLNSMILSSFSAPGFFGANGYVVFINSTNSWTEPIDGLQYTANASWQNAGQQCVYFGTSNTPNVQITGLAKDTKYYFKIFAYKNCSGGNQNYEKIGTETFKLTDHNSTLPSGDGTVANPYAIANLENLTWVMNNSTSWNKHFIQVADIDARTTKYWNDGAGFSPIGTSSTSFSGTYNAIGHVIDSLYMNRSTSNYIALFGCVDSSGRIDNLGLTNVEFYGKGYTGGLVGSLKDGGVVNNCFTEGIVKGVINGSFSLFVGGLVGINDGYINACYSDAVVVADSRVGGLVGKNDGVINNSFSHGYAKGRQMTGGMVGYNTNGLIENCYSTNLVNCIEGGAGGLVYFYAPGTVNNSFWDMQTSGQTTSGGGTGLNTTAMQDISTYINAGWDFMNESENGDEDIWYFIEDEYPLLKWQGCWAPESAVSNIVLDITKENNIVVESFESYSDGYAIYINSTDNFIAPSDGDKPDANNVWQNTGQQCIYIGSSNNPNIVVSNVDPCLNSYYLKVYAYNVCSGTTLYETTGYGAFIEAGDNQVPAPDLANLSDITNECLVIVTSAPTATDNCAGTITGTTTDPLTYTEQGSYTITWTYDDGNGNTSTQEQTVIVNDNTAPVADVEMLSTISDECSVDITSTPTAIDNCAGSITGTTSDPLSYTEQGTYTITWAYDDGNGNITTQEQNVTIDDNTAPFADVAELSSITSESSVTITTTPTATDNCAGTITGTTTDPLSYNEQGTYTITWTYDDGNGNTSTQEQTVIIDDNTAPIADVAELSSISDECSVTITTIPTATDNLAGTITGTTSDPLIYSEQGTYTITWIYDDGNGNISSQEQTIIVNDDIDPTILCISNQVFEITLDETTYAISGSILNPLSIEDNCGIASIINNFNNSATLDGDELPIGITSISWTITDNAGNTAECIFNVNISQSTGINGLDEMGVSIYPNPVNEKLNIKNNGDIKKVIILDITGRILMEKTDISVIDFIDMSKLNSGIYLINIYNGKEFYTSKIIKE